MGDPLSDCSPLISAAASFKPRLVRLLVEGGAQVNGRNPRGETPLLAACKALRGQPAGPETLKLLTYLLQNKADPNAQDWTGRTALMYACMERAGAQVASTLLAAGADPSMEDHSRASALVYAINAQHQPTLEVLMEACRARGHDIIIIATDMGVKGGPVTRQYLNVPPSPDTSPVSCMSPSDIVLKTASPNSPEGENIFNFRGTSSKRGSSSSSCERTPLRQTSTPPARHRMMSEPWLAIHNLARLNQAYEQGMGGGGDSSCGVEKPHFHQPRLEERKQSVALQRRHYRCAGENYCSCREDFFPRPSGSAASLTDTSSLQAAISRPLPKRMPGGSLLDDVPVKSSADERPVSLPPHSQLRRNTLPSLTVIPPPLHLPPLVDQSDAHLRVPHQGSNLSRSMVFLPHPPHSSPPSSSSRAYGRAAALPQLLPASSLTSLAAPASSYSKRSPRRHSIQCEPIRGETI